MEIKLAIADDHIMIINGIRNMLKRHRKLPILFWSLNGSDLLEKLEILSPDVLLLDIRFRLESGIELCRLIRKLHPKIKIIALSNHEEPYFVKKMIQNGASGYLLKNTSTHKLIQAVETVYNHGTFIDPILDKTSFNNSTLAAQKVNREIELTKREHEILKLIGQEYSNQEIADKLLISLRTVETHRLNLHRKLEVRNTAGLVKEAYFRKLI